MSALDDIVASAEIYTTARDLLNVERMALAIMESRIARDNHAIEIQELRVAAIGDVMAVLEKRLGK